MNKKFSYLEPLPIHTEVIKAVFDELLASGLPWARNGRMQAGLQMANEGHVVQNTEMGTHHVISSTGNKCYHVDIDKKICTCPDRDARNWPCKHRIATHLVLEACRRVERVEFGQVVEELATQEQSETPAEELQQPEDLSEDCELENDECDAPAEIEQPNPELADLAMKTLADREDDFLVYSAINFEDWQIPVEVTESYKGDFYVRALPDFSTGKRIDRYPFHGFHADHCKNSTAVHFSAFVAPLQIVTKTRQFAQAAA